MGVLAFRIALKIYYKSFSKYLAVKNIGEYVVKSSKVTLKIELEVEDLFNLSILLLRR